MEMALREAMERVSSTEPVTATKKKTKNSNELEDILKRTLRNKVATRQ
jgi:hypothetical protein